MYSVRMGKSRGEYRMNRTLSWPALAKTTSMGTGIGEWLDPPWIDGSPQQCHHHIIDSIFLIFIEREEFNTYLF